MLVLFGLGATGCQHGMELDACGGWYNEPCYDPKAEAEAERLDDPFDDPFLD